MTDFNRSDPPKSDPAAAARDFARMWVEMAKDATDIAHAKRTLFLAYVAEGFNETQALDLVKSI
jgi:hypothetical protein